MKKNFSEVELINGPDYIVNRTPFVDKLSNDFDVVVQYIDQYKDLIDSLEHDFLNDDISYALYEESTEKGGGGDFVSHILQDPYIQSVVKFLINGVAEWFVSKAADNVYEKIKKLLVSSGSSKNYGIYFIAKIDGIEHWFYFNSAYTDKAVDLAIKGLKTLISKGGLSSEKNINTYFFDYSSRQWISI